MFLIGHDQYTMPSKTKILKAEFLISYNKNRKNNPSNTVIGKKILGKTSLVRKGQSVSHSFPAPKTDLSTSKNQYKDNFQWYISPIVRYGGSCDLIPIGCQGKIGSDSIRTRQNKC